MTGQVTIAVVVDVPGDALDAFRRYESLVLPLLHRYGGDLVRRLRDATGTVEIHVLAFPDEPSFGAYLADPERARHRHALAGFDLTQRVVRMSDVPRAESFPAG